MNTINALFNNNLSTTNYINVISKIASVDLNEILENLSPEQQEALAKMVMSKRLIDTVDKDASLAGIDYQKEKKTFLENAGKEKSKHTYRTYALALSKLEQYCASLEMVNPLSLTPAQADDFIYSFKVKGMSANTVRITTTAASSFFAFLERRHKEIHNPFRGSRARPTKKPAKKIIVPTAQEVKAIIKALPPMEAVAVSIMAYRGLRVGALPSLSIVGNRYTAHSKGKDISGTFDPAIIKAIKKAGLKLPSPFADFTSLQIQPRMSYVLEGLQKKGVVKEAYSSHDFRHFFAVTEYNKDKDIYRLCKLLNHASIAITETYLKSLNVID
jgi:site-specific recombinase XerD